MSKEFNKIHAKELPAIFENTSAENKFNIFLEY